MRGTALIAGISGQDGSYLTELLLSKGYEVHAFLRRAAARNTHTIEHLLPSIHFHEADLCSAREVRSLICEVRPTEIYNLAGPSEVEPSWRSANESMAAIVVPTTNMLEAVREVDNSIRFFQACSSEMFGSSQTSPQHEQTPFSPRNPYGIAKQACFHLVRCYRERYDLFAASGILFNHESPRRGLHFVTRKITAEAARIKHGLSQQLRIGNMHAQRDWSYAGDIVDGIWHILQHAEAQDFVLGSGQLNSVGDFLRIAFEETGLSPEGYVTVDPAFYRPCEAIPLCADPSKAREELGWTTTTTLRELIAMMVENDLAAAEDEVRESAYRRAA